MPQRDALSVAGSPAPDTDRDANDAQIDAYRRLGGHGRVEIMFRLIDTVRAISMSGIRHRHPGYTDEQIRMAYARLRLGDALMREIWPGQPLVEP